VRDRRLRLSGLLLLFALLTGCESRLPGFANPPPVDGGAEDDDAGDETDSQ
jgi:hypothetical protein